MFDKMIQHKWENINFYYLSLSLHGALAKTVMKNQKITICKWCM